MAGIAVTSGSDRQKNIKNALGLVVDEVKERVAGRKEVLIKPNLVSTSRQLAATHVDAVDAVLEFLTRLGVERFVIAEGPALTGAEEGYGNFGYYRLKEKYEVEFMDLNGDKFSWVSILDQDMEPISIRVSKRALQSDCRISIGPMKTHDTVVATLSLKNVVMGSVIDKGIVHQGYGVTNLNLFLLSRFVYPHISVIDGFVGMEGSGPESGDPVEMGVAVAGTDYLSVDLVALELMGFDISDVGYLSYCKRQRQKLATEVLGDGTGGLCRRFRPHDTFPEQKEWRLDEGQVDKIRRLPADMAGVLLGVV